MTLDGEWFHLAADFIVRWNTELVLLWEVVLVASLVVAWDAAHA